MNQRRNVSALVPSLAVVCFSSSSYAQDRAPHICSPSDPIDLVSTSRSSAVDIAVSGTSPTMWLLYSNQDNAGQESTYLMEVSDVAGADLTIRGNRSVGSGYVMQGGLAIVGNNVVAVYVRPDRHIGVFTRAIAGGVAPTNLSLDAPEAPFGLSVTAVGNRALVAWDDPSAGIRHAWLDNEGTVAGPVQIVAGHFGAAVAAGAFGGALVFADSVGADAHVSIATAGDNAHAQVARASAGNGAVTALSATDVPGGIAVAYTTGDGAHLATYTGASGAGRDRLLGSAGVATETVLAPTSWGVFAAWTYQNNVRFLPLTHAGAETTGQFIVRGSSGSERMRLPAMSAFGSTAILVWNASNLAPRPDGATTAVRMVRVECR